MYAVFVFEVDSTAISRSESESLLYDGGREVEDGKEGNCVVVEMSSGGDCVLLPEAVSGSICSLLTAVGSVCLLPEAVGVSIGTLGASRSVFSVAV